MRRPADPINHAAFVRATRRVGDAHPAVKGDDVLDTYRNIENSPDSSIQSEWEKAYQEEGGVLEEPVKTSGKPVGGVSEACPCGPITDVRLIWLEFLSDHKMLKDETSVWTDTGTLYAKPDWRNGRAEQNPISHTLYQKIKVKLLLDVRPDSACPDKATIEGTGAGFSFRKEGVKLEPGLNVVELESKEKIRQRIEWIDLNIWWTIETERYGNYLENTENIMFVTYGTPRKGGGTKVDGVTFKRMSRSVALVGGTGSLIPHTIVSKLMGMFPFYTLKRHPAVPERYEHPTYFQKHHPDAGGAWVMADYMDKSGECQAIVRLVQGVIYQVGCPGTAEFIVVWADPDINKGRTVLEGLSGLNDKNKIGPNGKRWYAHLADEDPEAVGKVFTPDEMGMNNFEACLRFTHGGVMKYYGGGAGTYDTKEEVIGAFHALVWWSPEFDASGNVKYRIEEIVRYYDE
ncbi:MAG: hypothetical protein ACRD68_11530 [Pyrinomonadaceae bacterium]